MTSACLTQPLILVCETSNVSGRLPAFCNRNERFDHSPGSIFLSIGVDNTAFEKSKDTVIEDIGIVVVPSAPDTAMKPDIVYSPSNGVPSNEISMFVNVAGLERLPTGSCIVDDEIEVESPPSVGLSNN